MGEQKHVSKEPSKSGLRREAIVEEVVDTARKDAVVAHGEEVRQDLDALVGKIDDILESNAEEFVKNYVQRGGE